ncbi:MAG: flagellar biosynthetic protein FliO [Kineosporiaceae bacterium]
MSGAGDLVTLARVTVSLLVVLGVVVIAARLARRAQARGGLRGLRVLHRTPLSREASVAVVAVGSRGLLIGVTAQQVSLLAELAPGELAELDAPDSPRAVRAPGSTPVDAPSPSMSAAFASPESASASVSSSVTLPGAGAPPAPRGSGSVLSPATWAQAVEALRDVTARRR